ncbi:hypothetical protein PMAYCL1PPCAC_14583, partial [Pristionchus mayeri]
VLLLRHSPHLHSPPPHRHTRTHRHLRHHRRLSSTSHPNESGSCLCISRTRCAPPRLPPPLHHHLSYCKIRPPRLLCRASPIESGQSALSLNRTIVPLAHVGAPGEVH